MKKIVIAGGSGFLGKFLTAKFRSQGDEVSVSYREAAGAMTASEIRVRVVNRN